MNKTQKETLKSLNIELTEDKEMIFEKYAELFLERNSILNLISKNDEKFLFEKHIFDSLAINKFLGPLRGPAETKTLLDIGTGGGFPSVPVSLLYDEIEVHALDSIKKKINAIEHIKQELNIKNLKPVCERAENIKEKFDYITTRAVAPVDTILRYAAPRLKENGYFIAYKSKRAMDELKDAQKTIKRMKLEVADVIEYTLPLDEVYERNLIIFKTK